MSVWYLGRATVRIIGTHEWNAGNGYSLPDADFTTAEKADLAATGEFDVAAPVGPRLTPSVDTTQTDPYPMYVSEKEILDPNSFVRTLIAGGKPTRTGAMPVGQNEIVFSVRDYGATATSNATGSTGTDDTAAIRAAVAAAAATGGRARVVFPAPSLGTLQGYRTTDTISVPSGVDLEMHGGIIYAGPAGRAALVVGETGVGTHRARARHLIKVRRGTLSSWLDETDVGVKIFNQYYAVLDIADASNFTVGAQLIGSATGFAYNHVFLGSFLDNRIGIELDAVQVGWVNQNDYYGGSFWSSSLTNNNGLSRTAIRITSSDGTYINNNCNIFHAPSFEIGGAGKSYTSYCLDVIHGGPGNKVLNARCETVNPATVVHTANAARPPYFQASYNDGDLKAVEDSTRLGVQIEQESTRVVDTAKRLVFTTGAMHKTAAPANGSGTVVNVPGLAWAPNSVADGFARYGDSIAIGSNYVTLTAGRLLGTFLTTKSVKTFSIIRDAEVGFGGRIAIRAYDASGVLITEAGAVRSPDPGIPFVSNGSWSTGSDATAPLSITVSAAVEYIFVAVKSGSLEARIRSFSVFTSDALGASTAYLPWVDAGNNYGTVAPTAGTWAVGKRIYNAVPTAGGVDGWVCVTAGTPGVWKSFGAVAV